MAPFLWSYPPWRDFWGPTLSSLFFISIVAAGLIAFATFQFGSASIWRALTFIEFQRNQKEAMSSMRQAAELARLQSDLQSGQQPGLDWRVMEVAEIVDESEDCRSFYLVDPYGEPLPDFRPGQYLMVRPAMAGAYQAIRCYSLSSSPNERFWRITVKRQDGAPEEARNHNGGLSRWLHGTITEGDCLFIGGPSGQFFLPADNTNPLVLLAAGVGITPMASMLRWSLEHTPERKVVLIYQVKDLDHWPLGSSLHSWKASYPNIELHTFCSRVSSDEVREFAREHGGKFHVGKFGYSDVLELSPGENADYFMCGPDPWMNAIRDGLLEHEVEEANVHWESFGGTGNQPTVATSAGDVEPVCVDFQASDVQANWSDPEQTVWELARESGVEIPSGCLSGVCGCCRVKLMRGEVEYDREITLELAEDECLTCVSRPKSELVIDV